MKISINTSSYFPKKGEYFWQIEILPTVSILRQIIECYTVITFGWLFWSISIFIE